MNDPVSKSVCTLLSTFKEQETRKEMKRLKEEGKEMRIKARGKYIEDRPTESESNTQERPREKI